MSGIGLSPIDPPEEQMRAPLTSTILITLLITLVTGCDTDSSQASTTQNCNYAYDCTGGKICKDGTCQFECVTPSDCEEPLLYNCQNNKCVKKGGDLDVKQTDTTKDVIGTSCMSDSQCLPQAVCLAGICGRECDKDLDCGDPDLICQQYRCVDKDVVDVKPDTSKIPCTKNYDCVKYDMACIDGWCDRECEQDIDCGDPDKYCYAYKCFDKNPDDTVNPPDVKETTTLDIIEVKETIIPDIVDVKETQDTGCTSSVPGCVTKPGQYGEGCKCACECETEMCVNNKSKGYATCTQGCAGDFDCPDIDTCITLMDQSKICYFNDSGYDCNTGCTTGLSVTNLQGMCKCTVKCANATKCPDSYGCGKVNMNGVPTKMCVYVSGQSCNPMNTASSPCFGMCYPLDDAATQGICTIACDSTSDCPSGMYCFSENIGGQIIKTCQYY